jgi:hypothetical protein
LVSIALLPHSEFPVLLSVNLSEFPGEFEKQFKNFELTLATGAQLLHFVSVPRAPRSRRRATPLPATLFQNRAISGSRRGCLEDFSANEP